jgi:hypothetical protein
MNPVHNIACCLRFSLILSSHLLVGRPSSILVSGFPTEVLYAFLLSLVYVEFRWSIVSGLWPVQIANAKWWPFVCSYTFSSMESYPSGTTESKANTQNTLSLKRLTKLPNECLTLLFRIWEVPGSIFGLGSGYLDWCLSWFFSGPPGKSRDITLN